MSGVISLVLERDGHDQPWGFRLQGGSDVALPLSVQRVLVGSPADGTLLKGDIITRISCTDTKGITHQQAADLFNNAGNQIAIHVKRPGVVIVPAGAQPATAAPLVNGSPGQAAAPAPAPPTPEVTGSLQQIQQNQNSANSARLPSPNPELINRQYNSPLPLYSAENVQEAMMPQVSPSHTPTIKPAPTPSSAAAAEAAKALRKLSSPIPANKPAQVILTPSKEYNPQSSATWRALQETDAPVDPEKVANYTSLKEHDPIYSEVYAAPVAPKPGQRPQPRTNALPGPRSPVSELLPSSYKAATNNVEPQDIQRSLLSPPKIGPSAVQEAAMADSKPINHQMTTEPIKIPLYEDEYDQPVMKAPRRPGGPKTNSIGGRRKIAQTATFNKLMMDVLGE
ncbi:PDZ and LIM domain protein 1-like isoform X15 [Macrobrachium rosenbergii]|uniref:PDZ and LIM domain protein 1-like isoform X15 n=1 Tax=Macrobrachium rosenbergii TaxID=79674 RepID=UPI0034D583DC